MYCFALISDLYQLPRALQRYSHTVSERVHTVADSVGITCSVDSSERGVCLLYVIDDHEHTQGLVCSNWVD